MIYIEYSWHVAAILAQDLLGACALLVFVFHCRFRPTAAMAFELTDDQVRTFTSLDEIYEALQIDGEMDNATSPRGIMHTALGTPDFFMDVDNLAPGAVQADLAAKKLPNKYLSRVRVILESCAILTAETAPSPAKKPRTSGDVTPVRREPQKPSPEEHGAGDNASPSLEGEEPNGMQNALAIRRHPGGIKLDILVNPSLKSDLISMDEVAISGLFIACLLYTSPSPRD